MAYLIAFMFIPFMQIGVSFYISGATVVAAATILKFHREITISILMNPMKSLAICLAFIMPMMYEYGIDSRDIQRALRETVFMLLMISAFSVVYDNFEKEDVRKITNIVYGLVAFYFLLVLVQTFFLSRQVYFGLPRTIFIANETALPGELDLLYSQIRPTGTFGEPSYLGFVMTSFAFVLFPLARNAWMPRFAIAAVLVCALITQSLSFFLAIGILVAYERPGFKKINGPVILAATVVLILLGIYFSDIVVRFAERLTSISDSSKESSGFVRIFGPISVLPDYLAEYPTGAPFYKLYPILEKYVPIGLRPMTFYDNGLINFVLDFGFYGFLLLYLYFSSARDNTTRIYLFAAGIFNGALLSPDKLGVLILMVALYNSFVLYLQKQSGERGSNDQHQVHYELARPARRTLPGLRPLRSGSAKRA